MVRVQSTNGLGFESHSQSGHEVKENTLYYCLELNPYHPPHGLASTLTYGVIFLNENRMLGNVNDAMY